MPTASRGGRGAARSTGWPDQLVIDSLADAATRTSPRLLAAPEARAILEAVAG